MTRADVYVEKVRSLIGTPLVHRGRSREGVDCSGLFHVAFHELGLRTWQPLYGTAPSTSQMEEGLVYHCVQTDQIVVGTILQLFYGRHARHLAMFNGVSDGNRMIVHADPESRRVATTVLSKRIHKTWWPIGVDAWLPGLAKHF